MELDDPKAPLVEATKDSLCFGLVLSFGGPIWQGRGGFGPYTEPGSTGDENPMVGTGRDKDIRVAVCYHMFRTSKRTKTVSTHYRLGTSLPDVQEDVIFWLCQYPCPRFRWRHILSKTRALVPPVFSSPRVLMRCKSSWAVPKRKSVEWLLLAPTLSSAVPWSGIHNLVWHIG